LLLPFLQVVAMSLILTRSSVILWCLLYFKFFLRKRSLNVCLALNRLYVARLLINLTLWVFLVINWLLTLRLEFFYLGLVSINIVHLFLIWGCLPLFVVEGRGEDLPVLVLAKLWKLSNLLCLKRLLETKWLLRLCVINRLSLHGLTVIYRLKLRCFTEIYRLKLLRLCVTHGLRRCSLTLTNRFMHTWFAIRLLISGLLFIWIRNISIDLIARRCSWLVVLNKSLSSLSNRGRNLNVLNWSSFFKLRLHIWFWLDFLAKSLLFNQVPDTFFRYRRFLDILHLELIKIRLSFYHRRWKTFEFISLFFLDFWYLNLLRIGLGHLKDQRLIDFRSFLETCNLFWSDSARTGSWIHRIKQRPWGGRVDDVFLGIHALLPHQIPLRFSFSLCASIRLNWDPHEIWNWSKDVFLRRRLASNKSLPDVLLQGALKAFLVQ